MKEGKFERKGVEFLKYQFKSYKALEEFFVSNCSRFKAENLNSKVIGKCLLVFAKKEDENG